MKKYQAITQRINNKLLLLYDMKGLKTHCPKGHEYQGKDFFIDSQGTKRCKICIRENNKRRYWEDPIKAREYNKITSKKWRKENHDHVLEIERRSDKKRYKQKLEYWNQHYPSYVLELQTTVLTHYGNGKLACVCCGENKSIKFLTLDHINGDGGKERKNKNGRGGWKLYQYLRNIFKTTNKWPDYYQTLCWNCNSAKGLNKNICPHIKLNELSEFSSSIKKIKEKVLTHYGNGKLACVCCGENKSILFLTLDHINGRDKKTRRDPKQRGYQLIIELMLNDYPKGYRTLCWCCNSGRARNKGICPHKELQKS